MNRTSSCVATVGAFWRQASVLALLLALLLPWGQFHHHSHDAADSAGPESCALCVLGQGGVLMPPTATTTAERAPRCVVLALPEDQTGMATLPDRATHPRAPPSLV